MGKVITFLGLGLLFISVLASLFAHASSAGCFLGAVGGVFVFIVGCVLYAAEESARQ